MALVLFASTLLMGCGSTSRGALDSASQALSISQQTPTPAAPAAKPPDCDPLASFAPPSVMPQPNQMPQGSFMRTIQERGRLVVGIDQTTVPFGYRNPETGNIEGFDADVLREIARAIFGNPDAIEFKAITFDQRL